MKTLVYTAPGEVIHRDEPAPALAEGSTAFRDLAAGRSAAAKIVLRP
jgi:hypothetical protein